MGRASWYGRGVGSADARGTCVCDVSLSFLPRKGEAPRRAHTHSHAPQRRCLHASLCFTTWLQEGVSGVYLCVVDAKLEQARGAHAHEVATWLLASAAILL